MFRVGDKVKITDSDFSFNGSIGVITDTYDDYYDVYIEKYINNNNNKKPRTWHLYKKEIVLFNPLKEEDLL